MDMTLRSFQDRYGLNNREVAELIGCSLPTIQKWRAGQIVISPSADRLLRLLDHIAKGQSGRLAIAMQTIQGDVVPRKGEPEVAIDSGVDLAEWTAEPGSDREAFAESVDSKVNAEHRFRAMVASQPSAICLWRLDGVITYANEAFGRLFSSKCSHLIGQRWVDLLMERDREEMEKQLPEILRVGKRTRLSHILIEAGANLHTVEWALLPISDRDGVVREWMSVGQNITEEIRVKRELLDRLRMETLVAEISKRFIHITPDNLNEEIHHSLDRLGTQTGSDRVYLFFYSPDFSALSNTHEWCAEGIPSCLRMLQNLPASRYNWWIRELSAGRPINLYSMDQLPEEASLEQATLKSQGIQSVLVLPINGRSRQLGFLGFDSVSQRRVWRDAEISLLAVASDIFAKAFESVDQQAVVARAHRYREVATELAHLCTWIWHLDGDNLQFSSGITSILGYSVQGHEMIEFGRWFDFIHCEDHVRAAKAIDDIQSGASANFELEVRLMHREGAFRWCCLRGEVADRSADGSPAILAGAMWDITKRREAELRLQRSKDFYRSILQNFPLLVWRADADGRRNYFNEAYLRYTGKSLTELVSGAWLACIHPDDRDGYLTLFEKSFGEQRPFTRVVRVRGHEGEYRWMRETCNPIVDARGVFIGVVGAMQNESGSQLIQMQRQIGEYHPDGTIPI
jgi:PAS domain S-box-containing protein